MPEHDQFEKEFSQTLIEGDMNANQPDEEARDRLSPRYEIRIKAEQDPIVQETIRYRQIAAEADNRYDDYMNRAKADPKSE